MTTKSTKSATHTSRIHPANLILCAVGCLGIGALLGGWAAEQPARRSNAPEVRPAAAASQVSGLAIDSRNNFLYRTFADGRVERLPLGAGVDRNGSTAAWQPFKSP